MSREEYLKYRNEGSPQPLYEYYKENCKKTDPLDVGDFFRFMSLWPMGNEAYGRLLRYYDITFEVMSVQDLKTGQILKYL
jgi:hypothetical protein